MKIIETYDNDNTSIFYYIKNIDSDCPFIDADNIGEINQLYYLMHSGDKQISILYKRLLEKYNNELDTTNNAVAKLCITNFYDKWTKLYNTIVNAEYNPLEASNKTRNSKQSTNTDISNSEETDVNVYGFDTVAVDGVPKDKNKRDLSVTGDAKDNYIELEENEEGNDGRYSKQQLLEQEINIRKHLFYDIMFADVDKLIANRIYSWD